MRTTTGLVMLAGAMCAADLQAQGTVPGWYTETRTTSMGVGERAAAVPSRDDLIRTWETGGNTRVEGGLLNRVLAPDAYTLSRPGERRSYQVMPATKQVRVLDMAAFAALRSGAGIELPEFSGMEFGPAKALGDGGLVLGHQTRKYALQFTMTERSGVRGAAPHRVTTRMTTWVAEDPADSMVAAYVASRTTPSGPRSRPRGMTLRSESRTQGGSPADMIRTSEVVAWRREAMDAARFAVPTGYARVDVASDLVAKQAALVELRRLTASADPKDRARARQLGDSLFQTVRDTARERASLREHATVITDTVPKRKKPRS